MNLTGSQLALLVALLLCLAFLGARVIELVTGGDHAADLHAMFEALLTATLALLAWEVHNR